jgi:hypothetical protein
MEKEDFLVARGEAGEWRLRIGIARGFCGEWRFEPRYLGCYKWGRGGEKTVERCRSKIVRRGTPGQGNAAYRARIGGTTAERRA